MSDIPQELVDLMMAKCGRRCCICRRFRPTKLLVHHIIERANGGTNEQDNLIVTCFSCHSDVHTKVPFSRRFTVDELKLHRDALCKQVANGILPSDDADDGDIAIGKAIDKLQFGVKAPVSLRLFPEAAKMLVAAATADERHQSRIYFWENFSGNSVQAGGKEMLQNDKDQRELAAFKRGLNQLLGCGLVEQLKDSYTVTYDGFLVADDIGNSSISG